MRWYVVTAIFRKHVHEATRLEIIDQEGF